MHTDSYTGVIEKGSMRGGGLGFPTINIPLAGDTSGIFAAIVEVGGETYEAAAYADQKRRILEAHLFAETGELYGKEAVITLMKKIRDSRAFADDEDAKTAIASDVEAAQAYFMKGE